MFITVLPIKLRVYRYSDESLQQKIWAECSKRQNSLQKKLMVIAEESFPTTPFHFMYKAQALSQ